jgi:hypothetical protein
VQRCAPSTGNVPYGRTPADSLARDRHTLAYGDLSVGSRVSGRHVSWGSGQRSIEDVPLGQAPAAVDFEHLVHSGRRPARISFAAIGFRRSTRREVREVLDLLGSTHWSWLAPAWYMCRTVSAMRSRCRPARRFLPHLRDPHRLSRTRCVTTVAVRVREGGIADASVIDAQPRSDPIRAEHDSTRASGISLSSRTPPWSAPSGAAERSDAAVLERGTRGRYRAARMPRRYRGL